MIEIAIQLGPDAFDHGQFIYVWLDSCGQPIYVGETAKSPSDRAGLHIRDSSRSGAIVGKLMKSRPHQLYTVLAFPIEESLLVKVAHENTPAHDSASRKRARKAIERLVYERLSSKFAGLHPGRGCTWRAGSAVTFADEVLEVCIHRATDATA